ncbi:MAG: VacJ family lipoprotein, partial [Burkholderiales bacterium]|nr:VacJ family lipoprotein [Burkholderiales bacterium]
DFKLPKHNEDFGQTLGRWGIGSGAYLVLPFFGSSSLRDGIGLVADLSVDPVVNMGHVPTRNASIALRTASMRAGLLDESRLLEEAALDKYRFVRNAYLQRRRSLVYDGNPPEERQRGASAQPGALARARAGDRADAERPGDAPAGARDASAGAGDARGAVAEADRP